MTDNLWRSHTFTILLAEAGTSDVAMLSYDPALSRIRIDEKVAAFIPMGAALNTNPFFETNVTGWVASGGASFARSTAQAHEGAASGLLTPDGSTANPTVENTASAAGPVTVGQQYSAGVWVYSPTGYPTVNVSINWYTGANAFISTTAGVDTAAPAGAWKFLTVTGTAPATAAKATVRVREAGTPLVSNALYVDEAVLYAGSGAGPVPAGATRVVQRSTNLTAWVTVRGGADGLVDVGAVPLDDYEFIAGGENTYRVLVYDGDVLVHTFRDSIVVTVDAVWLKSVRRPFLNRTVTVTDYGDVERTSRSGAFDVVGRSLPVAVTDLHGSQRYTVELTTVGQAAAREMDLVISSGDLFYIQGPVDCPVQDGYYIVSDLTRSRKSTRGEHRYFTLPLTQVATPHALLEGVTFTWRSMANTYATWVDVANAALSWRMVTELIGTVEDVVVP